MHNIKIEQIDKDGENLNWKASDENGTSATSYSRDAALEGLRKVLYRIEHKGLEPNV